MIPGARPVSAQPPPGDGSQPTLYLPDFCTANAVLAIVIICELTALVLSLARNEAAYGFWPDLARTSMFLLWIGLFGAAMLCVLRGYLNRQSVAKGSVLVLALTAALVAFISSVAYALASRAGWFSSEALIVDDHWTFMLRNVVITIIVTALALRYFYVTHEWRHNVELQARARVHALQARIRPHFLFNSMNTIAALTRSNPQRAEEAVEDLADLFRASLSDAHTMISLKEEFDIARTHQRIEQLRLGDRLQVNWDIDELPMRASVPCLIVQPLLENAVYHGIEMLPAGGTVHIRGALVQDRIEIEVRNPVVTQQGYREREGNKMALENIRQRLELAWPGRARVETDLVDAEFRAKLIFPFTDSTTASV